MRRVVAVALATSHRKRLVVLQACVGVGLCSTLAAHARGKPLPVSVSQNGPSGWSRAVFSNWNETVKIQAPANFIPLATVHG